MRPLYRPRPASHYRSSGSGSSTCQVPEPQSIARALAGHEGLARLGRLLHESNRRMAVVLPALPGTLSRFVRAGPVDEEGWSLLAANAAVAAKLRHLQPHLEAMLAEQGIHPHQVRIKVQQQS